MNTLSKCSDIMKQLDIEDIVVFDSMIVLDLEMMICYHIKSDEY